MLTSDVSAVENAADGGRVAPPRTGRPRPRARIVLVVSALGVVIVAAVAAIILGTTQQNSPAAGPVTPAYDARGRVVPVREARVMTQQGGIVLWLLRQPGAKIAGRDEIARIEGPTGELELLTAPYEGTVLDVPVQLGDTLPPAALVARVGDMSELRVQTSDVDEYLVASISVGMLVDISVDALPGRTFSGRVNSVSLEAEPGTGSRLQYPVVITIDNQDAKLRPSMTAHLRFGRQPQAQ